MLLLRGGLRDAAFAEPGAGPGGSYGAQYDNGYHGDCREGEEAVGVGAGGIVQLAHRDIQVEAAKTARRADKPCHDADIPFEALRNELEDRAVAHSKTAHQDEQEDPGHGVVGDEQPDANRGHDGRSVEEREHSDAAEAVGERAPDRPEQRTGDDEGPRR